METVSWKCACYESFRPAMTGESYTSYAFITAPPELPNSFAAINFDKLTLLNQFASML